MRIISGKFKNKKIILPKDDNTRPLKDVVRESIFNIIQHSKFIKFNLENSIILDLFSGSGSFGLECISRGANEVLFCENYHKANDILLKNIINFDCKNKTIIFKDDVFKILKNKKLENKKFDIIFIDPPFKEDKILDLFELIINNNIVSKNTVIIIHRNKKYRETFHKKFNILFEKEYGLSKIIFGNF